MDEPSLRSSRLAIAGGAAAALLLGGGGFLVGRSTTERVPAVAAKAPAAAVAPAPAPEPATAPAVLGRSDLITLAGQAADATAAGRDPPVELAALDGRRFEIRLPFGCDGPAGENSDAAMRWTYDAEGSALRIHVSPSTWPATTWWTESPPPAVGAIRGFWIARPWTSSEECPVEPERSGAFGVEPMTLPGQTLAIGQVVPAAGPRDGEPDRRPYDAVVRVPEGELDTSKGFRLRVSGRMVLIADRGPVRCRQPFGPEQRPICLFGVDMDEVAIENAATGETLATWNMSPREATAS